MYNIAVVGCGMMSDAWIEYAISREDCKIIALVDVAEENAVGKKLKHNLDAKIYTKLENALEKENINLVFDVTPPEFHYNTVSTSLKLGCNVFGEKPMSDTLENAYKLVSLAEETKKEYFVMQNRRYISTIYGFRNFLQSNKLGEIGQLSADFQLNPHFGGFREEMKSPLIADMAIHTFDAARFLLGKNPVSVYCKEFNPKWSWYKDSANAVCIFEMEDGSIFDYRGSWCANGLNTSWESQWRASCRDGSAFWDGFDKMFYEKAVLDTNKTGLSDDEVATTKFNDILSIAMQKTGHHACLAEMFNALQNGIRPQTDCRDNIKSIEMVYKAIESAKTGKLVTF